MIEATRINETQVLVEGHLYTLGDGAPSKPSMFAGFTNTNWRTTVSGLVTAASAFVAFSPQTFSQWPLVLEINKFVLASGIASLGLASKDSNRGSNLPTVQLPTHLQGTGTPTVPVLPTVRAAPGNVLGDIREQA